MTSEKSVVTEQRVNALVANGRETLPATAALNITSAMATVPGLSSDLGVGTYHFRAQLVLVVPTTAGQGQLSYRVHPTAGLTVSNGGVVIVELFPASGVGCADVRALDSTLLGSTPGTAGTDRIVTYDGIFVVSVAGTLNIQIAQGATSATSVAQYGSYLEVLPVA